MIFPTNGFPVGRNWKGSRKRTLSLNEIKFELIVVNERREAIFPDCYKGIKFHEFDSLASIKFLLSSFPYSPRFNSFVRYSSKWNVHVGTSPLEEVSLSLSHSHLGLNRRRPLTSVRFGRHYRGIFNRGLDGARTPLACHTRPNKKHCLLSLRYLAAYEASR